MKNFKFIIQYEGTKYYGWQRQKGSTEDTIQGKIENILTKLDERVVSVVGSGRTDKGVHARGQVANAILAKDIDADSLQCYLNRYLPEDISVIQVKEVPLEFHSRHDATSKTYIYRIGLQPVRNVFERRYRYDYGIEQDKIIKLDLNAMQMAVEQLKGMHDFQGFCGKKIKKKSTVRNIFDIKIDISKSECRMEFIGNGFLFHMIRILAGTLLEIGLGERKISSIKEIMESCDRAKAGTLLPAHGLTLSSVVYKD